MAQEFLNLTAFTRMLDFDVYEYLFSISPEYYRNLGMSGWHSVWNFAKGQRGASFVAKSRICADLIVTNRKRHAE